MSRRKRLSRDDVNAPESWCCIDCGFNTAPGCATKDQLVEGFNAGATSINQTVCADSEIYMVHDHMWKKAGMKGFDGCLCIGCLEKRIDRRLIPDDFSAHIFNRLPVCTRRLAERQGRYDPLGDFDEAA
jgi:hypothetical protein